MQAVPRYAREEEAHTLGSMVVLRGPTVVSSATAARRVAAPSRGTRTRKVGTCALAGARDDGFEPSAPLFLLPLALPRPAAIEVFTVSAAASRGYSCATCSEGAICAMPMSPKLRRMLSCERTRVRQWRLGVASEIGKGIEECE